MLPPPPTHVRVAHPVGTIPASASLPCVPCVPCTLQPATPLPPPLPLPLPPQPRPGRHLTDCPSFLNQTGAPLTPAAPPPKQTHTHNTPQGQRVPGETVHTEVVAEGTPGCQRCELEVTQVRWRFLRVLHEVAGRKFSPLFICSFTCTSGTRTAWNWMQKFPKSRFRQAPMRPGRELGLSLALARIPVKNGHLSGPVRTLSRKCLEGHPPLPPLKDPGVGGGHLGG